MLIVGAKGLAKEVLEIFHQRDELEHLFFYDDISLDAPEKLFGQFPLLRNMEQVAELFTTDNRFIIGIGKPDLRFALYTRFMESGGKTVSAISPLAAIGHYGTNIEEGTIIMGGTVITNSVKIGRACLINPNCTISHDTLVGDFVEISPGVQITGNCIIGSYSNIGTNATILPGITLGTKVTVGSGAVVIKNIEEGMTVAGVPAKPINKS